MFAGEGVTQPYMIVLARCKVLTFFMHTNNFEEYLSCMVSMVIVAPSVGAMEIRVIQNHYLFLEPIQRARRKECRKYQYSYLNCFKNI